MRKVNEKKTNCLLYRFDENNLLLLFETKFNFKDHTPILKLNKMK